MSATTRRTSLDVSGVANASGISLFHRAYHRRAEYVQSGGDIRAQMYAERATFTLDEDREVPARLCRLGHTERIALTRDQDVLGIVGGDLKKDTAVRASLVGLTGGVQEKRAESERSSDTLADAHRVTQRLQSGSMRLIHREIRENRKIVALLQSVQVRAQICCERPIAAERLF